MNPQEIVDYILEEHGFPSIPVQYSSRMKSFVGKQYSLLDKPTRIVLSEYWRNQESEEYNLSVIIHETCHAIEEYEGKRKRGVMHSNHFFELSEYWHEQFGIKEIRESKRFHGKVYRIVADGRLITPEGKEKEKTEKEKFLEAFLGE